MKLQQANLLLGNRVNSQNPSKFLTVLFSHSIPRETVLYSLCSPLVIPYFEVPLYHFPLIPCLSHL